MTPLMTVAVAPIAISIVIGIAIGVGPGRRVVRLLSSRLRLGIAGSRREEDVPAGLRW